MGWNQGVGRPMFLWETLRESLSFLDFTIHPPSLSCGPSLQLQRVPLQSLCLYGSALGSSHPSLHLTRTLGIKLGSPDYPRQSPHLKIVNLSHLQNLFQGKGHLWGTLILSTTGPNEHSVLMSRMNEHRGTGGQALRLPPTQKVTVTSLDYLTVASSWPWIEIWAPVSKVLW